MRFAVIAERPLSGHSEGRCSAARSAGGIR